ncbi:MAG: thiamine phosphate synthase [Bacteroidales bacterium]
MQLIIITTDKSYPQEATVLNLLFEAGLGTLHLRKPSWSREETIAFLHKIDERFYPRIVLHDHYDILDEISLKGFHLNERNADKVLYSDCFKISNTIRSIDALEENEDQYRFHFLSPVYDSVSKQGYKAAFTKEDLEKGCNRKLIRSNTIALGGVTEDKLEELNAFGFGGVALLGDFWNQWVSNFDNEALITKYLRIQEKCNQFKRRNIARLHAISCPNAKDESEILTKSLPLICAGVPAFQFRNKHIPYPLNLPSAAMIQEVCTNRGVLQIINDHPEMAIEVNADGVHLGKTDMPVKQARQLMGNNFIIGGTANTMQDIRQLAADGADYIGLGPFRFTTTKKNLSPVIGLQGYQQIMQQCREENITIPVIAIGGIMIDDIPGLMATGIHGIAMSSGLELPKNLKDSKYDLISHVQIILNTIHNHANA